MVVRAAVSADEERIRGIHLQAFGLREGRLVADLASALLCESVEPAVHSLVAEREGDLVGHMALSPVRARESRAVAGYILAPLAVDPGYQNKGAGTTLVREGLRMLAIQGVEVLFVYGDPAYYGRFGFTVELAANFRPPFRLGYPSGWQAVVLGDATPGGNPQAIECVKALRRQELW